MIVAFDTKFLREVCENEPQAKEHYGSKVAKKLKTRLADLRAADSMDLMPTGSPNPIGSKGYTLNVVDGFQILVHANHVKNPELNNGKLDWARIKRIKVMKVEKING